MLRPLQAHSDRAPDAGHAEAEGRIRAEFIPPLAAPERRHLSASVVQTGALAQCLGATIFSADTVCRRGDSARIRTAARSAEACAPCVTRQLPL